MAGLIPQQQPQRPMQGPAPQQQPAAESGEEAPNVSPEEQEAYNQFVANGHLMIYDNKTFQRMLATLKGDDPAEALAMASATLVKQLSDSARKQGREIPGDVLLHGGQELFEELADLQADSGIANIEGEQLEGAWYRALDLFRGMAEQDGSLDMRAVNQDMQTLVEADQQGMLDQILPGTPQIHTSQTQTPRR